MECDYRITANLSKPGEFFKNRCGTMFVFIYIFNTLYKLLCLISFLSVITGNCFAQVKTPDTSQFKIISAGAQYKKPHFYQWLWGSNRT